MQRYELTTAKDNLTIFEFFTLHIKYKWSYNYLKNKNPSSGTAANNLYSITK